MRVKTALVLSFIVSLLTGFSIEAGALPSYQRQETSADVIARTFDAPSDKKTVNTADQSTNTTRVNKYHSSTKQEPKAKQPTGNSAKTGIGTNSPGRNFANAAGSPAVVQEAAGKANPELKQYFDASFPGGKIHHGPNGEVAEKGATIIMPGQDWPAILPPYARHVDEYEMAAWKSANKLLGFDGPAGRQPATNSGIAGAAVTANLQEVARMQMPETWMPIAREMQNQENRINADNYANLERCQSAAAIDFCRTFLTNFTTEGSNKWNRLRNGLFVPMAMLILLPGAVLAQVRATIAQGFSVFGNVNPFDGIIRAIIAIFLIPGTYLVVNYGIDVSNSVARTIQLQYKTTFDSEMYDDAMAAQIRAFPVRQPHENKNFIPHDTARMDHSISGSNTALGKLEGRSLSTKILDVASGKNIVPPDRADEMIPYFVHAQRANFNGLNAALATTWTILCAFQMVYLYYLWFVGPIVAALWVWPMQQLRQALPNWIDGVVTICFWSLFWNTSILLMACFRGVDDTGTVIMSALNFLTTASVKSAFDFSGLVRSAGSEAARMAEERQGEGKGASTASPHAPAHAGTGPAHPISAQSPGTPNTAADTNTSGGNRNVNGFQNNDSNSPGSARLQNLSASSEPESSLNSALTGDVRRLLNKLATSRSLATTQAAILAPPLADEIAPATGARMPWETSADKSAAKAVLHVPPPLTNASYGLDTERISRNTRTGISEPPRFRGNSNSDALIGFNPPHLLSDAPGEDTFKMVSNFAVANEATKFRAAIANSALAGAETSNTVSGIGGPLALAFDHSDSYNSLKVAEGYPDAANHYVSPGNGNGISIERNKDIASIGYSVANVSSPPPSAGSAGQIAGGIEAHLLAAQTTTGHYAGSINPGSVSPGYFARSAAETAPVESAGAPAPNHVQAYQSQSLMRLSQQDSSFPQTSAAMPSQSLIQTSQVNTNAPQAYPPVQHLSRNESFRNDTNQTDQQQVSAMPDQHHLQLSPPPLTRASRENRTVKLPPNRLNRALGSAAAAKPEDRHVTNQEANTPRKYA